jgi:hypothetical protein
MPSMMSLKIVGIAGIASYALARVAVRLGWLSYHRYRLIALPRSAMPPMPRGFRVEPITPQALSRLAIDVPVAVQAARFAQGMDCLGAYNAAGDLTGVTWVGAGGFTEDEVHVRFEPPPGCGWDTGLWIAPEHRMGRSFAALWAGTAAWMAARGLSASYSRITDHNLASIAAHRRLGAAECGRLLCLRVRGWQWIAGARPALSRIDSTAPPRWVLTPITPSAGAAASPQSAPSIAR